MTDLITELHALAQRMAAAGETDEPTTVALAADEIERLQQQNEYLSALASGQPLYGLEEKIADLMQRNKALREERDQLKAILQDVNTSDYRFSVEQLSVHDADVIQRFKDELVKSVNVAFRPHIEGVCAVVQQQISQKAKEV